MNRARVFVQEMFGHNDRHRGGMTGMTVEVLVPEAI